MLKEENENLSKIKPILKWAGGKRELVPEIRKFYEGLDFKKYYEPFFGGGAVYFDLLTIHERIKNDSIINDINGDLMNMYKFIKTNPNELMKFCDIIEKEYYEHGYYHVRGRFNGIDNEKNIVEKYSGIERAAALIVINRTCFNGIYRINSNGLFNVPTGKYKNPKIYDKENLLLMSNNLPKIENIRNSQFNELHDIKDGDLVYFDPPYHPLNDASFTAYAGVFGIEHQLKLKEFFLELDNRGVYVIQSNSSANFIKELYSEFTIKEVLCSRNINSKGDMRGKIFEYLIIGNTLNKKLNEKIN